MQDEFGFAIDPVTIANLKRLSEEASVIGEERILELAEYVDVVVSAFLDLSSFDLDAYGKLSLLSDALVFDSAAVHELALEENVELLSRMQRDFSLSDKAVFSTLLVDRCRRTGIALEEGAFLSTRSGNETFAYVRNQFSDEAFDVLSLDYSGAKVKYFPNFSECVRAVVEDSCQFCLLPLEERGGVRLHSVSELIFRQDLKINSVTPVFGLDNSVDIKYALLSKILAPISFEEGDDRYIEIRLDSTSELGLSDLLSAASYFGNSVYRVNTQTFELDGGQSSFFTVVLRGERDFSGLLCFLTLFADDYTVVGLYKNVE